MVEAALEGGLRRAFPTRLQPVLLAKAAARAMEDAQVVGLYGAEVPNAYTVKLAPEDMERFADFRGTLAQELAQYLDGYARDRGMRPVAPIRVQIDEGPGVRPGTAQVDARFVDVEPQRQAVLEEALEGTRRLRLEMAERVAPPPSTTIARAWLEDDGGRRHDLDGEDGVVRVGRSLDNDVVLASQRVSRYHAHLRQEAGRWLVYDLQSTNGTYVADRRLEEAPSPLASGDRLWFGDQSLTFRTGP